jgi:hypothetical protein
LARKYVETHDPEVQRRDLPIGSTDQREMLRQISSV